MPIPQDWRNLGFTSGRRTYRGNKMVGGVGNSGHLTGTAADFTADAGTLRQRFPGKPILDEGDHRHVSGLSDVPYHGNRGIAGLVNGVDTSAPQGRSAMIQPRKPRAMGQQYYPQQGGMDPLMPEQLSDPGMSFMGAQPSAPQQQFAQAPQIAAPKGGKGMKTLGTIAGILGDAMAAYGGQRGVFAPAMAQQMSDDREENRWQQQLQAKIEMEREKRMNPEPPAQIQLANYLNGMDPAERNKALGALDMINPNYQEVTDQQGNLRRVLAPRSGAMQSAPPQDAVSELQAAIQQGDQGAIEEFEQVFGPGSARKHLGQ